MPNRVIRVGFLDSEAIHSLTDSAECFYHRLMLVADDAGRFDGRIDVMRSACFPLDGSRRRSNVVNQLREVIAVSLVYAYEVHEKPYVQLTRWQRCGKAATSKYPDRDGKFTIRYVKVHTRDGEKEFVSSSLPFDPPLETPSAPHPHGVGGQKKQTNTKTETDTKTETVFAERANSPTLEQALAYFAKLEGSDYKPDEVKTAWLFFEGTKDQFGQWRWNNTIVGDWRAIMETRMATGRKFHEKNDRTDKRRPDRNAGTTNEGTAAEYRGLGKVAKA